MAGRGDEAATTAHPEVEAALTEKPEVDESEAPLKNCFRLVIVGSSKVGKTAIVSRFLENKYDDKYTPTIENFHRKIYSIRGESYRLDILDTSGNDPFPAMRRLSLMTGLCNNYSDLIIMSSEFHVSNLSIPPHAPPPPPPLSLPLCFYLFPTLMRESIVDSVNTYQID